MDETIMDCLPKIISTEKILAQLQQQIELAPKVGNFNFLNEIAVENFIKNVTIVHDNCRIYDKKFRNNINDLLSYLVYLFESNGDPNKLWLIHKVFLKFLNSTEQPLTEIITSSDLLRNVHLIGDKNFIDLSMITSLKLTNLHTNVTEFYKLLILQHEIIPEDSDILQSLCIKLRNSLYKDPINTSIVLKILSDAYESTLKNENDKLNVFQKIHLQGLIHSLKNQNKKLMIEILLRSPDCILNDENLVKQIVDFLVESPKNDLLTFYTYALFCPSSKLIKFVPSILKKDPEIPLNECEAFFNPKNCFLQAIQNRKHFLREFLNFCYQKSDCDFEISDLPIKSQFMILVLCMYNIVNGSEDVSQSCDHKVSKLEAKLNNLFSKDELEDAKCQDQIFSRLVEKIKFVMEFSDWCFTQFNSNNEEKFNFRYEIIAQLMTGTSLLKILSNHDFFEIKTRNVSLKTFQEEITCDYLCDLISKFDRNVSMILKAFIAIRFVVFCVFSKENESIYFNSGQLLSLLQDIYPIDFRLEVMEDIFALLFLSKNDFKEDPSFNSDDEDYLDETISSIKEQNLKRTKSITKSNDLEYNTRTAVNFICPNWLIPKLLEILKDMLYKTNSELFHQTRQEERSVADQRDVDEIKHRISTLLKYVSDAQFRYDVIRPAFFKSNYPESSTILELSDEPSAPQSITVSESSGHALSISNTSSDTDHKNQSRIDTALISCMLASHTQLLCYTLIENRLESSRQIANLFKNDLKNSKPYKELQLLDYFAEFHSQICNVRTQFNESQFAQKTGPKNKNKIDEITSLGIRSSRIQSLLYEMLVRMDQIEDDTKIIFMLDYALSSSPSLEIGQSILESLFIHNSNLFPRDSDNGKQQNKILPDKIENFVVETQKFISQLGKFFDISDISIAEFLEISLTFPAMLDAQAFVDTIKTQIELCKWYHKFHSLMVDLERQIIDDPSLISGLNPDPDVQSKSNLLNNYFDQLMNHCPMGKYQYLMALYLYVCKVNKALIECRRRNINSEKIIDTSIIYCSSNFSILKQSPSAILCSMVIKSKISPRIIDDLATVMKVNLIGVLCSVYCPPIPSHFSPESHYEFIITDMGQPAVSALIESYLQGAEHFKTKLDTSVVINDHFDFDQGRHTDRQDGCGENSFQPMINHDVLNYFYSKCSVLVEIIRQLNLIDESQFASISSFSPNLQIFPDSPLIKWIEMIKKNFFCGDMSSTLTLAFYGRIPAGHNAIIKTLEHYTATQNYLQVYKLFQYIEDLSTVHNENFVSPSVEHSYHSSFEIFKNAINFCLAFIKKDSKYVFQIVRDPKMKADLILILLDSFEIYEETFYATRLIRLGLQSIRDDEITFGIDASDGVLKLQNILKQIEFYASVGQLTGLKTWKSAKNNLASIDVLTIIKTKKRYSLAIDWYHIRGFENETFDLLIELLIYAYSETNSYVPLKTLFNNFNDEKKSACVIVIVEKILNQTENLELRTFLVEFLIQHYRKKSSYLMVDQYEKYKLGVEIVKLLSRKIQTDYMELIPEPILLIEQLLMNSEIEALEKIIDQYKLFRADDLVEKYAQKSVYIEVYDSSFDGSDMTIISSESSQTRSIIQFLVPPKIPSKDQWVSDMSKTHCMLCQAVRFSMINRRHHCRRCGRVVCNGCSSNSLLIPEINANTAVRVCDDCFNWYMKQNDPQHQRKNSVHSMDVSGSRTLPNHRTIWKLSLLDDSVNQARRLEFVYESAPSVSLCLAILRLHSDKTKSCKFIIDKICAPLIESISARSVDSTLLIEMIRSLLISTRLAFEEDTNSGDPPPEIEQLNLYLDRLDVIRMLINANYGSKEMIGFVLSNNIQKLQEKLLEAERFELTIDIAKKYGIESSPIWKSWALICLKHFHFSEARQKFVRYFDQVKRIAEAQNTLNMIVETLVSINSISLKMLPLKDKCMQIINGRFDFQSNNVEIFDGKKSKLSQHLKPRILQEIVYYFETYGTLDDQLNFYVNHSYWKEAVECFLKSNSVNLSNNQVAGNFLQRIYIPAQTNGCLSQLFTAIRQCDPQQTKLGSCLITVCRYLNKNEFYHCLYRLQVFMNDYLRAAITQINHFFLSPIINKTFNEQITINLDSFDLLNSRMNHLEKARDYCNAYLHNIEYIKVKTGCLVVDKRDVFKQIRLIELQMDILKRLRHVPYPTTIVFQNAQHLDRYLEGWSTTDKPLFLSALVLYQIQNDRTSTDRLPYPPTLLEHDCTRKSLITALIILYYGGGGVGPDVENNMEDGFRCALRIIQDHQLDAELVYRIAAMFVVAHNLEHNRTVDQITSDLKQLLMFVHSLAAPASPSVDDTGDSHSMKMKPTTPTMMVSSATASIPPTSSIMAVGSSKLSDDIIFKCLRFIETIMMALARQHQQTQNQIELTTGLTRAKLAEVKEALIKLIADDQRRIEAYLHVGKLKLAYLLAANIGQRENVERVLAAAQTANDQHYVKICEMWLKKNSTNNPRLN